MLTYASQPVTFTILVGCGASTVPNLALTLALTSSSNSAFALAENTAAGNLPTGILTKVESEGISKAVPGPTVPPAD